MSKRCSITLFTARSRSCGKVMFSYVSIILCRDVPCDIVQALAPPSPGHETWDSLSCPTATPTWNPLETWNSPRQLLCYWYLVVKTRNLFKLIPRANMRSLLKDLRSPQAGGTCPIGILSCFDLLQDAAFWRNVACINIYAIDNDPVILYYSSSHFTLTY